jgi:hypothetical protein
MMKNFYYGSLRKLIVGIDSECPSCMNSELESMPLSLNEIYIFDHDEFQGVSVSE